VSGRITRMEQHDGTTEVRLPELPRCAFPGCQEWGEHDHHITYDPEVKKPLCVGHHQEITILNGQQARKYRRELSNKHRWWILYQWTQGKLKVRRTRKSLEWIEDWQETNRATTSVDVEVTPDLTKSSEGSAHRKPMAMEKGRGKKTARWKKPTRKKSDRKSRQRKKAKPRGKR
jgi:hypothetical protein